ncbi:MAG: hypothetical protein GY719_17665 [bacterium]|nr:hypothetical protein [bacterium]
MTVVADSGPLIALAKIGGLGTLFELYPVIATPRAVYEETVRQGRYAQAADAALLRGEYESGRLRVEELRGPSPADSLLLGRGEREGIQLALQQRAEWLLVDDLEARQAAAQVFTASGSGTRVKGTLGIIASAYVAELVSLERAIGLLDAIRARQDIWVSADLCKQVEDTLRRAAGTGR